VSAVAAILAAAAALIASVNGVLQWRHRLEDDRRFAEIHSRLGPEDGQ
jgi:hypothetical protein